MKKVQYTSGGKLGKSWNPNLGRGDMEFQNWYDANTAEAKEGRKFNDPKSVYDFYSYWKNTPKAKLSNPDAHFPDTYKYPNHPTFSNESIYSTPENPGGSWSGENYNPNGKFVHAFGGNLGAYMPKLYFTGSELSFTDYMKNNPQGISAIGAAGSNQQLQPMGQAQSAPLQLAPNNHPAAPVEAKNTAADASSIGSAATGTISAFGNMGASFIKSQDKPGGSMAGSMGSGALSGAAAGAALGPIGMAGGAVLGAGMGFLTQRKADNEKAMAMRQQSLDNYAAGTSGMDSSMHNYALGGPMITRFNGGGTHEQNPNGGIQQGFNQSNGRPNLVEDDETKSNVEGSENYIFPARTIFTNPKEYNLGGNLAGLSFADAHKKIAKYSDERTEDKIARDTLILQTARLKQANEDEIALREFESQNPQDKTSHYNSKDRLGSRQIFKYGGFIFKDI